MTTIDTTEGVAPVVTSYTEPAEQILSDDETEALHTEFAVGDLVRIVPSGYPFGGKLAVVTRLYEIGLSLAARVIGTEDPDNVTLFLPSELKLIRRAERPGWKPLRDQTYRPGVYKDNDGVWVCEDDLRLQPRFRHPIDDRLTWYRDHKSYEEALTTVREQAAIDQAKRDGVEIASKGIVA